MKITLEESLRFRVQKLKKKREQGDYHDRIEILPDIKTNRKRHNRFKQVRYHRSLIEADRLCGEILDKRRNKVSS